MRQKRTQRAINFHTRSSKNSLNLCIVYINITIPGSYQLSLLPLLPVLVFVYGGAFFLGSSCRLFYSPISFNYGRSRDKSTAHLASINYRLGALGFLHSRESSSLLPPNNGLHDQLHAFEWIRRNISGSHGDPDRITAAAQATGGDSLSLHTISGNPESPFKQIIAFSSSPVTVPCKTRSQHQETSSC